MAATLPKTEPAAAHHMAEAERAAKAAEAARQAALAAQAAQNKRFKAAR
ncbi:hypothetical protein AB0O07_26805 [Streptomyces sp. NPDC093085]